jgi:acylphosphatase
VQLIFSSRFFYQLVGRSLFKRRRDKSSDLADDFLGVRPFRPFRKNNYPTVGWGIKMKRLEATVHGHVQGVFFRASTRDRGQALGLTGGVRNQPDGTVRVVAEGPEAQLYQLLQFLNKGPSQARVTQVDVTWGDATREFTHFATRYT